MIFLLNKNEKEKINNLIETKYYNDEIADYINNEVLNKKFQKEFLNNVIIDELDIKQYQNDKYYQNVKIPTIKRGVYQLSYDEYLPSHVFLYDDLTVDENDYYLVHNHLGYFLKPYRYLTLKKDNIPWMSVIPHEINTMQKLLVDAKTVYIYGLGLGYYPFFLNKCKKIVIVDSDINIINLFKENILPYFPSSIPLEIICDDAFKHLKTVAKDAFIFIDLWHDYRDGLMLYYRAKKELKNYSNVTYWLEENIVASFRHLCIDLIEEELYHPHEYDYKNAKNDSEVIINKLHQYWYEKKITSYRDIQELLTTKNLKKIIAEI